MAIDAGQIDIVYHLLEFYSLIHQIASAKQTGATLQTLMTMKLQFTDETPIKFRRYKFRI